MLFLLIALLALKECTPVHALDSKRTLAQYVHTVWGADKGYVYGPVYSIAQSADGYLWLGTERGLVRFDGFDFTPIEPFPRNHRALGPVRGLVEDVDGTLWIRLDGPRLLRYRDGVFEDAVTKYDLFDLAFTAMSRDSAGNFLLWGPQNRTLRFRDGRFNSLFPKDRHEGVVISLVEPSSGGLWLGTREGDLYRMEKGGISQTVSDAQLHSINVLAPSEHGGIWIGSETGLHLWERGAFVPLRLPDSLRKAQVIAMIRDHNHNVWVGTDAGLYRIDPNDNVVTGYYRNADSAGISSLYEDHDGDIWFAGSRGVERLRDGMFTSIAAQETTLNEVGGPLFVDDAGRTWFAPVSGGLFCLENGIAKRVPVPGLDDDVIYSIGGTRDDLWLGRQRGGLTELKRDKNEWRTRTFTQRDGLAQNSVYTVTRTRDGDVWAGTVSGGISVLHNGRFKTYTVNDGLQSNAVFSSMEASDKTMWFASPSGLVRFDGGRWTTYGASDASLDLNVRTAFEDSNHMVWVGTSHGLARFHHEQVEMLEDLPQVLREEVLSIGQDAQGFLWVVTNEHVLQIDRTKLLSGTLRKDDVLSYGVDDGLNETQGVRRDRSMVSDSSGRIWLSLPHSLAVADVSGTEGYRRPVRVRIDSVSPDGAFSEAGRMMDLPANTRSVTLRFGGMDMSMPQRTHFRYRLDGLDRTWSGDTSSREVVYSHLSPGSYRFRIMASNALGAWNGSENEVAFRVRPALWQTWYFRTLTLLAVAFGGIALYRIRLVQVTQQLNKRFQDRLAERTRIARDLHDTLLQGVISASMQLDVAQDRLPDDSPARPMLGRVLQLMRQVTEEGREALRGLRTIDSSVNLEAVFRRLADELFPASPSVYHVQVEGHPRQLKAAVLDEVYRIGREAYINAAAHAGASHIDVMLEYEARTFRLLVKDDGCGIDSAVLKNGLEGRWGLSGMRERAEAIGTVLKIRSRVPGGTAVELIVPAAVAYLPASSRGSRWPWRMRTYSDGRIKTREP